MDQNYGRVFTMKEAEDSFKYMLDINRKYKDFGYFKVFEADKGVYIGLSAIAINDDFTDAEIEYMLISDYWNKGYGSEIVRILINILDKVKSLRKITAITAPDNIASKKILLKNGFISQKIYQIDDGSLAELFIKNITASKGDKKVI